ncbi:hypothetical protein [Actinophytocola sediminis]
MSKLVIGVTVLVALVGCTGTPADSAPTPGTTESAPETTGGTPAPGAVAWMTGFCTVASDLSRGIYTSSPDTDELRTSMLGQLENTASAIDAAIDRLAELPAAPVDGGDTAVSQFGDELTELRDALARGRDEIDALPTDADDGRLGQVFGTVWPTAAARAARPLTGVTVTDAMRGAATDITCGQVIS